MPQCTTDSTTSACTLSHNWRLVVDSLTCAPVRLPLPAAGSSSASVDPEVLKTAVMDYTKQVLKVRHSWTHSYPGGSAGTAQHATGLYGGDPLQSGGLRFRLFH